MRNFYQIFTAVTVSASLAFCSAASAQSKLPTSQRIRYSGPFTNTTYNLSGDVFIDLTLNSNNEISGYINFTNYPNVRTLCGAGNLRGRRQDQRLQFSFTSSDPEPDCGGFDRGWIFTVTATLSSDNVNLENGSYQVDVGRGSGGGSGVFRATSIDPIPYPSERLGSLDYYKFRYNDFIRRNPTLQPPDYYLGFGEKYLTRFMTETYPNLSPQGQGFLQRVGKALQSRIENRLRNDSQGFSELEKNPDEFRTFAYDTHPEAYCESGWGNLSKGDRDKIIRAVDRRDLYFSRSGLRTGWRLAGKCAPFFRDILDVFTP